MSIRTDPSERQEAIERLIAATDAQLREDLAYWAVAVADHEKRWTALTNERDEVGELYHEAQAHVRLVTEELQKRREKARARGLS